MKAFMLFLISALRLTGGVVELLPAPNVAVFGGARQPVDVVFRNRAQTNVLLAAEFQVLQASSATAAPWSELRPWRSLALLPSQASVERAEIDFPVVREESQFIVRFASGRDVLGLVQVRVYPRNILNNVADSVGPVIISSVRQEIRQVLSDAGFKLTDSSATQTITARPQLSIHGPDFSDKEMAVGISEAVDRAKCGFGVVLILPDYDARGVTAPSYYPVPVGRGTLVTVRVPTG